LRLQQAREMLTHTSHSVQQVLRKLGYKSASSFTQTFVQRFGVLPRDCRRTA
jgi:transcriptional regulator GlxA family with amidase domain